jgi:hypothetical protein
VLPIEASTATDDGSVDFPDGRFLLRAVFTFADGTTADGHITYIAAERSDMETQEPAICTDRGQVPLWRGALVPSEGEISHWLAMLGRPRGAVFPVRWRATLHPAGTELAGTALGFGVWRNGRVEFA